MRIKEYNFKKDNINQAIIFESNNDVLLPFLKYILQPYVSIKYLSFQFLYKKRFWKSDLIIIKIDGFLYEMNHISMLNEIKRLISNIFQTEIEQVTKINEVMKIFKIINIF